MEQEKPVESEPKASEHDASSKQQPKQDEASPSGSQSAPEQDEDGATSSLPSSSSWWGGLSAVAAAASGAASGSGSGAAAPNWNVMGRVNSMVKAAKEKKLDSVVKSAKEKSDEVYGFVSKDLSEVSSQATSAVSSTATTLKKTLEWDPFYAICGDGNYSNVYCFDGEVMVMPNSEGKDDGEEGAEEFDDKTDELADRAVESVAKSMSTLWSSASGYAKSMFLQEDTESEAILIGQNGPMVLDRLQAQLYTLASDPETFLGDPSESELWNSWKCDLERRQGEIEDLMINNVYIRQNYKDLVPDKVSHKLFWTRYFFKIHLLELQEQKRQELKKRAEQIQVDSDSDINWDDVEDLADSASPRKSKGDSEDIPKEVQDKLLSDYEEELKAQGKSTGRASLKDELESEGTRMSPEKDSTTSDDWEKLSGSGSNKAD